MNTSQLASKRAMIALALPLATGIGIATTVGDGPCKAIALQALRSCQFEARADFWLTRGNCTNLPDPADRLDCRIESLQELDDRLEECREILAARLDICNELGGGRYNPEINPDDFVQLIDNTYLPWLPGKTYVYEKEVDGEVEHIEVTVLNDTKEILGIDCTVVQDVVFVDGELVEDTFDWYAQDDDDNVWYMGEISRNFEDGELVDVDGSWLAGKDGAQPGIVMSGAPEVGDFYRQEYLLREAEDMGAVLSTNETVTVPYGMFTGCLQTEDFTPIEPDALEHKFYAPGIGLVLEIDVESGERLELIDIIG